MGSPRLREEDAVTSVQSHIDEDAKLLGGLLDRYVA